MRRRSESTSPREDARPGDFLPLPNLPFHVLLALSEEDRHGWGIVRRVEEIAGERHSPSSGSLYLAIDRLHERGLISEVEPPSTSDDDRRRYWSLTPLGRRVVEAETRRLAGLVAVARDAAAGRA